MKIYNDYIEEKNEYSIIETFNRVNPEISTKYKISKVKFALSGKQRIEILDKANEKNDKHYLMMKMQFETGMRVNELTNLIISAINFNECYIQLEARNKSKYYSAWKPKTKAGNRIIPISKDLSIQIKKHIGRRIHGYAFLSNKGSNFRITSYIKIVNNYAKLCKTIGHTIGSHALRRTFASYLLNKGIKISDISKVLGHKNIKITMIYLYDIVNIDSYNEIRNVVAGMN